MGTTLLKQLLAFGCLFCMASGASGQNDLDALVDSLDAEALKEAKSAAMGEVAGRLSRLLEDVTIAPISLSSGSGDDGDQKLGFRYEFKRDVAKSLTLGKAGKLGMAYTFEGGGLYLFEDDVNPFDLTEFNLRASLFGRSTSVHGELRALEKRAKDGDEDARAQLRKLRQEANALSATISATHNLSFAEATETDEYKAFVADNQDVLYPNKSIWTWYSDLRLGLESDQGFVEKHLVYGFDAGFQFWSDDPDVMSFNVLEFPFVLTRWLTGVENSGPSSRAWPAISFGLEMVDAKDDKLRDAAGEVDDTYGRFRFEAGYTTDFGKLMGRDLRAAIDYRIYSELSPSSSIKNADLDEQRYFQIALHDDASGFFISYAAGQLPFDVDISNVVSIGFEFAGLE